MISEMSQVQQLDKDLIHSMQLTRSILRIIGLWPVTSQSSLTERSVKRILNCVCYFIYMVILIPGFLQVQRDGKIQERLRTIGPIINFFMSCVEYTILLYRTQEIKNGTIQMCKDWQSVSNDDRKLLLDKAQVGRKLVQIAAIFMYGGGLCFRTIVPLAKGLLSKTNSTARYLPCPGYFVHFNEKESPAYEIIYTLQFLAGFLVNSVRCGLCGLSAFFIMHVCGQLRILIDRLNTLADKADMENVVNQRISTIVNLQNKLREFLKRSEQIVQYVCVVEIMGCTFLLCFVGYYSILEAEKKNFGVILGYMVLGISFGFSIFIFCYIGQCLVNESTDVAWASCTIDWYRLPMRKARYLLLIIRMSNIPMKVTAGKMIDMSLSSFTDIMKSSVAYLNMLRTMS